MSLTFSLGVAIGDVGGLGFALKRFFARREGNLPTLPDDPGRRPRLLEEELEQVQSEVTQLREEREFERRPRRGEDIDLPRGNSDAAQRLKKAEVGSSNRHTPSERTSQRQALERTANRRLTLLPGIEIRARICVDLRSQSGSG